MFSVNCLSLEKRRVMVYPFGYDTKKGETTLMTRQIDCTLSQSLLETLTAQGLDALPRAFAVLLNVAMR